MKVFSDVVVYFNEETGWGGYCEGGIAQCYTIPTKTTENIIVTGAENGYHFYYIEDENDVFVYGDFANAGTPTWSSMGALFGMTFGGIINSMSEATDTTRYYAFFANSYQFKNELTFDGVDFGGDAGIVEIPLKFVSNGVDYTRIAIAKPLLSGNYYTWVGYFVDEDAPNGDEVNGYYYHNEDYGTTKKGWQNETYKTIIAKEEITNTWLLANIEEVKEEPPLAEITYNGETIAQLNSGETCTIKCGKTEDKEYKMLTDITVKIGTVPEPNLEAVTVEALPEAQLVKPSGNVVGFSQVNVKAKSPLPIEAGNATVMAMYLSSAEVGAIYKYTGTTDDTYENGALYVVEESGE